MKSLQDLTWREVLDRYGPSAAILLTLLLLVFLLPSNTSNQSIATGAPLPGSALDPGLVDGAGGAGGDGVTVGEDAAAGGGGGDSGGGGAAGGGGGGGGDPAAGGSTADAAGAQWGPGVWPEPGPETTCREDGFLPGFAAGGPYYQTVCVPVFRGDNGGATYQGVTGNKITIVRYVGVDETLKFALQGAQADDGDAVKTRVDKALVHYFNNHTETYGREVVMVDYVASDTGEAAGRRDAKDILAKHKPFLVFPSVLTGAAEGPLAEEMAAAGVICVCTTSRSQAFYQRLSPYVWGVTLPTLEESYDHLAEIVGKRLNNRPAIWARPPSVPPLDTSKRKFGLIYASGDPPDPDSQKAAQKYFPNLLAARGIKLAKTNSYKNLQDILTPGVASNLIAQHKSAGVTTIICFCDGLAPINLTQSASQNQYFPEWINPGNVLMDTTFTGRLYDKSQWRNSFGMSPLWLFFKNVQVSSGYLSYHHARPGDADGSEGIQINVRQAPIQMIFHGLQYAGPNLNPTNFALGLYRAPRTGGTPKAPLVYWTPESHTSIKDFTEIWWDEDGTGVDETGKNGVGVLLKSQGGRRYGLGDWPNETPFAFERGEQNSVFTSDANESFPHDSDGHDHGHVDDPNRQRCRSC